MSDPADTTPEARAVQLAAYRAMTGVERLLLAFRLSEEVQQVHAAGVAERDRHDPPPQR